MTDDEIEEVIAPHCGWEIRQRLFHNGQWKNFPTWVCSEHYEDKPEDYCTGGQVIGARPPRYASDLNAIYCAEKQKGLHAHPKDFALAARWTTALREAVAHRCPVNKVGATLVSDADMMSASARERSEAFVQTFKLRKK